MITPVEGQNTGENNPTIMENNSVVGWSPTLNDQCSTQYCQNGHNWSPQLALPHCNECRHPLVALRQVNCPVCNEPVTRTRLRIDHLAGTHPITKTCIKEYHAGPEYIIVEIDHTHNSWITQPTTNENPKAQSQQVCGFRVAQAPTS